ncbi:hypothetical protein [Ferrimonas marina]|uniref:Uncharacterized protein n=1 Tax=Ferrimonas marina TaxID=299255 RepID=A0A1M5MU82_9GAMM|nr:hypothetical protein [Ferrimonas marina]SHG80717.1 hypothetical protein SAMN02745129_0777 [Ferrimonas marina]
MTRLNRFLLLSLLLVCAIACYVAGSHTGALALILLGAALELAFWVGLFRRPKRS